MWETEWSTPPIDEPIIGGSLTKLDPGSVESIYVLLWMEHCIECAIPDCYSLCPLYVKRRDMKCARLRYGIYPNPAFRGLIEYGADVHFRRWGKLESTLNFGATSPGRIKQFATLDSDLIRILNPIASTFEFINAKRRINGLYRVLRDRIISLATRYIPRYRPTFDDFVAEVYNPNSNPVNLIIEVHQDRLRFRDAITLNPGQNFHRIPFEKMEVDLERSEGRILVYPENDAEVRLIFTWLDYVRYRTTMRVRISGEKDVDSKKEECKIRGISSGIMTEEVVRKKEKIDPHRRASEGQQEVQLGAGIPDEIAAEISPVEKENKPALKIKCVAWDLDNTLWQGILIEDGADVLTLRPSVTDLLKQLDERGILNTIVSKNDFGQAWARITDLGLNQYFVSPAINWGRKSANLRAVAETLNINIDTFAFIDDSPFERSEVATELPQVRVYSETEIEILIDRPEFDVPVSEESKNRRLSYLAEDTRKAIAVTYGDNYDDFLRSCKMQTLLFHPTEPKHTKRALELIQRSNQLNLSTRRYSKEDFQKLLDNPEVLSLAWNCKDRFGDYGTVGFLSVSMSGSIPVLRDLVISCRVAKKKVENAIFLWIVNALIEKGYNNLHGLYLPTARNHVLLETLADIGFASVGEQDDFKVLNLCLDHDIRDGMIVLVDAPGVIIPKRKYLD